MNCTEAAPTQSNPRVTDKVPAHTLQIAHYSHMNIPTRSPPPVLPGIRPSAPYVGIHPLPPLFLSSHHAPKKSISKPEISSSQHSSTHSMPFIILIRYFNANLIIYLHLNLTGRQRAMAGRHSSLKAYVWTPKGYGWSPRAMARRQRADAGRQLLSLDKGLMLDAKGLWLDAKINGYGWTPKDYGWTPKGYGCSPKGYGWTSKGYGWTPKGEWCIASRSISTAQHKINPLSLVFQKTILMISLH